jgi:hypothetical protein
MKPRTWMLAWAVSTGLCSASASFGQVTGTIKFDGKAPEPAQLDMTASPDCAAAHPDGVFDESLTVADGKVQNVVVSIKPADGQTLKGDAPKTAVKLDQKGCQYVPHVAAMMTGQELIVANSDPFLHNVHSLALDNPAFNFGQPNIDPGKKIEPMKVTERFKIKCDVHPWMACHVSVFEHPYFAVSKADGTFELPAGLPDGKYAVVAWQESLGEQEGSVEVKGGKGTVDFTFKPEGAANAGKVKETTLTLASLQVPADGKKPACASCPTSKAKALTAATAAPAAK